MDAEAYYFDCYRHFKSIGDTEAAEEYWKKAHQASQAKRKYTYRDWCNLAL